MESQLKTKICKIRTQNKTKAQNHKFKEPAVNVMKKIINEKKNQKN